jgi:hypothetical protein
VPEVASALSLSASTVPVTLVIEERYEQLRHGAASPREFPLPIDKLRAACEASKDAAFFPVADLRWLASVDKTAIAYPRLQTLRPLTPPQQRRLAVWAARRFGRIRTRRGACSQPGLPGGGQDTQGFERCCRRQVRR